MTAYDLSPAQIRNRRILQARRTLRRHWQRTNSCPICGSRPERSPRHCATYAGTTPTEDR